MLLVELQSGARVLDRVVGVGLNGRVQDGPGEETERELALAMRKVVDVDRVDDLGRRDVDIWEGVCESAACSVAECEKSATD